MNGEDLSQQAGRIIRDRISGDIDAAAEMASRTRFVRAAHRRRRAPGRRVSTLVAGVALASLLVFALRPETPSDLSYRTAGFVATAGAQRGGQMSLQVAKKADLGRISFSDGSTLAFAPGSRGRLTRVDRHGADVVLQKGKVRVAITPRSDAKWQIVAGPYTVRVTGTAFDVAWSQEEKRFSIAMHKGSVVVTGPGVDAVALQAGQSATYSTLTTQDAAAEAPTETTEERVGDDVVPAVNKAIRAAQPGRSQRPGLAQGDWGALVASGNFAAVVNEADKIGMERLCKNGSLSQLSALADASRYLGQRDVAERALRAQVQRFAQEERGKMAVFLLGRLADEEGKLSQATGWYARYLKDNPTGTFIEEALGRQMMVSGRMGDADKALQLARAYKKQYPHGSFAQMAAQIEKDADRASPATK